MPQLIFTWEDLPDLKDGHPSSEVRYQPQGIAPDGSLDYQIIEVPCGEWWDGGVVFCAGHKWLYEQEYPQGWESYPGDICPHGVYVGGCGIDWMCPHCESGEDV